MATTDIAQSRVEELESLLGFERLLSELSSSFVRLAPGEIDGAIEAALRRVCEHLDLDFAVLWQWSDKNPELITPTHFYSALKELPAEEPSHQEEYPWARQQLLAGRPIVIARLDDYPPEAAVDRETCRRLGVRSGLGLPLAVGSEPPLGALGFNVLRERDWPEPLLGRLFLLTQVFAHALLRQRHERALRESEERLALAAESAEAGLWTLDHGTGAAWATERARAIFWFSSDEALDLAKVESRIHPDDRELVRETIERASRAGELVSAEFRVVRPGNGPERWVASRARTRFAASGAPDRLMGVSLDITERKRGEEDLIELSRRLLQAHEEERALLARELHDDVTQRLAVLAIDLGRLERSPADRLPAGALSAAREELVRLSEDVHALAYSLHSSVLEELGLVEALRAECERVARQSPIEIALDLSPLPAAPGKDAALCLFRVAQEALANVVRHSGASAARLALRAQNGGLILAVSDDGVGFDPGSPAARKGLGLLSMRERVRLANGTLDVESAPGEGTTTIVWIPAMGGAR
jgi:PAS domain S-box-containing protein